MIKGSSLSLTQAWMSYVLAVCNADYQLVHDISEGRGPFKQERRRMKMRVSDFDQHAAVIGSLVLLQINQ